MNCFMTVNKRITDDIRKSWKEATFEGFINDFVKPVSLILFLLLFILGWLYGIIAVGAWLEINPESVGGLIYFVGSMILMVLVILYGFALNDECSKKRKFK